MLTALVEGVAKAFLPSIFCNIISNAAGDKCKNLRMAILMNDDLLDAYKKADDGEGWCYSKVVAITKNYPTVKKMITTDLVLEWLGDQKMVDIITTIKGTAGGRFWLEQQVEHFKRDLF